MFSESAIDYCDDVNKTTAYIRLILPTYLLGNYYWKYEKN